MSNKGNKYKIGIMVILSGTLLIAGLAALGVMSYFRKTYEFMTVVDTSVQGLEKGAKVKLRGVTIGQVKSVKIANRGNEIYIFMEFDPETFVKSSSVKVNIQQEGGSVFFEDRMKTNVKEGLRCKLNYAGITGNLFVDLGYYTEEQLQQIKIPEVELPPDHPVYIPAIPSTSLANILEKAETAITRISELDLAGISQKIDKFLDTINDLADNGELRKTMKDMREAVLSIKEFSENIKDTVSRERLKEIDDKIGETFNNANKAMNKVTSFLDKAEAEMKKTKIPETAKDARSLMRSSEKTMKEIYTLRDELRSSLRELDRTLRSAKMLFDYLEQHPSSLLKGKPGKPVVTP